METKVATLWSYIREKSLLIFIHSCCLVTQPFRLLGTVFMPCPLKTAILFLFFCFFILT